MGIFEKWEEKARRSSVMKFAAASGLVYTEGGVLWGVSVTDVPFPDGPAGPRTLPPSSKNMLSGRWQGLPVTEADFSILDVRPQELHRDYAPPITVPKFEHRRFSAVIADLPATPPDLMIQKKMPGFGGRPALPHHIESGSPEFNRTFQVTTANTTFAAKLIGAGMITWLLPTGRVFMFKLHGRNLLVVWSGLLPASGLRAIFDTAKGFSDHIPHQIWADYGTS